MKALLIVDLQNDFCPGGALPAPGGNKIIKVINRLMKKFDLVVASRDAHPATSKHFSKWPVHCVQGTWGAEYHNRLNTSRINQEFLKGTEDKDDGYSAFEATNADLDAYLKEKNISELYVSGLTVEYCVKASALDAQKKGYDTYVIRDAVAGVNVDSTAVEGAFREMEQAGIKIVHSKELH